MKQILRVQGNVDDDFWVQNPSFKYITEFADLKKEYENSSMLMWAIYLIEHPDSELMVLSHRERRDNVFKTMEIGEEVRQSAVFTATVKKFRRTCLDKAEYALTVISNRMDDLIFIIEEAELTGKEQFEVVKSYLKDYAEIQSLYDQALRSLRTEVKGRGDSVPGASETGELW